MGLNQPDFGEIFGLTQQSVAKIEKGKNRPSKTLLKYFEHRFESGIDVAQKRIEKIEAEKAELAHSLEILSNLLINAYEGDQKVSDFIEQVNKEMGIIKGRLSKVERIVNRYHPPKGENEKREAWKEFKEVIEPILPEIE